MRRQLKKTVLSIVACGAVLLSAGVAAADGGLVLTPDALDAKVRAALQADIEAARQAHPELFQRVATLRAQMPELDANKRGRLAPTVGPLTAMGPAGLMPMIEMLAFRAPDSSDLKPTAWTALTAGLLQAVGELKDPRSEPVIRAVLSGTETNFHVVRAAASALGHLGTDAAATTLVAMARTADAKQEAVLFGMGSCRRALCARALAEALRAKPAPGTARHIIRSLMDVGNSWAWSRKALKTHPERTEVLDVAAQALVEAYVRYDSGLRRAAANGLLVVDAPSTPALIAAARAAADKPMRAELDKLSVRFARNPARR